MFKLVFLMALIFFFFFFSWWIFNYKHFLDFLVLIAVELKSAEFVTKISPHLIYYICSSLEKTPKLPGKNLSVCPQWVKMTNYFQYLGKWYEQKRIPAFFQINTRCVRAEYGLTGKDLFSIMRPQQIVFTLKNTA